MRGLSALQGGIRTECRGIEVLQQNWLQNESALAIGVSTSICCLRGRAKSQEGDLNGVESALDRKLRLTVLETRHPCKRFLDFDEDDFGERWEVVLALKFCTGSADEGMEAAAVGGLADEADNIRVLRLVLYVVGITLDIDYGSTESERSETSAKGRGFDGRCRFKFVSNGRIRQCCPGSVGPTQPVRTIEIIIGGRRDGLDRGAASERRADSVARRCEPRCFTPNRVAQDTFEFCHN